MDIRERLDPLVAVVIAEFTPDGVLVAANAGFRRVAAGCERGGNVRVCFISPSFADILAAPTSPEGPGYRGLMTIGDPAGRTWSLRGAVYPEEGRLLLIAEHDVGELERTGDAVLDLNRELVTTSRELRTVNRRLVESEARVRELSLTDPLTGLANRRQLEESWPRELARAQRTGGAISLLIGDVDHFKRVNDGYGHEAGDGVLKAFAQVVKSQSRGTDLVARVGGEEFVVLLSGAGEAVGVALAGRIRAALAATEMPPLPAPVTASFGVAQLRPDEDWTSLFKRADAALYEAKRAGRDRVCTSAQDPAQPPVAGRV